MIPGTTSVRIKNPPPSNEHGTPTEVRSFGVAAFAVSSKVEVCGVRGTLGFGFRLLSRVQGLGFRVQGLGFIRLM